jgi:hypothetical protein
VVSMSLRHQAQAMATGVATNRASAHVCGPCPCDIRTSGNTTAPKAAKAAKGAYFKMPSPDAYQLTAATPRKKANGARFSLDAGALPPYRCTDST